MSVICLNYRDAVIFAVGIALSWLAIYLWVSRGKDR